MASLLTLPDRIIGDRTDVALLLNRLAVGATFAAHGAQKIFSYGMDGVAQSFQGMGIPLPTLNAYLASYTEFLGGIMLVLGLFTRVVSAPVAFTMVVAIAMVHGKNGFFAQGGGWEYNMILLVMAGTLLLSGAGRFSLDALIARRAEA